MYNEVGSRQNGWFATELSRDIFTVGSDIMRGYLTGLIDVIKKHKPEVSRAFFHYCRKGTLEKLFSPDAEIYCTHTAKLNDDREIFEGCELFLSFLHSNKGFPDHVIDMLRKNIMENINRFDPKGRGIPNVMPWTFSVSEVDDSPFQWKHYTDSQYGGYMLAISKDKLASAIAALNKANASSLLAQSQRTILVFLPCLYIGVDDAIIKAAFESVYVDMQESFEKIRVSSKGNDASLRDGINVLTAIFFIAAIIKRNRFRHEHEWRIVLNATEEVRKGAEETVGKPCLKTYISTGLNGRLNELFVQVMCSPQGNTRDLIQHAQHTLKECGSILNVNTSNVSRSVVLNYITRIPRDSRYEDYVIDKTSQNITADVEPYESWIVNQRPVVSQV